MYSWNRIDASSPLLTLRYEFVPDQKYICIRGGSPSGGVYMFALLLDASPSSVSSRILSVPEKPSKLIGAAARWSRKRFARKKA